VNNRYIRSTEYLAHAEEFIPLGSQTFSKSRRQYPVGFAPLFATRGYGAKLLDIDGNEYIDFVSNLASITLGYSDSKQTKAVVKQLQKGIGFTLPSTLEAIVAEKIVNLVPSVEMVRFAKNGTDATSAAVRLARAYTGRELVATCGYHGWQDWYIGTTTMNKGVPAVVSNLTFKFSYNDIQSLKRLFNKYPGKFACVILEPMNTEWPIDGFLKDTIELCESEGSICIFDETITGFRFSKSGAQGLFNVSPHLSTFGKGIANGYPLSVLGGKREIMQEVENIFFSGTFGGELASLAAADYVLDRHLGDEIAGKLSEIGSFLDNGLREIIISLKLEDHLRTSGHPSWKFLHWVDDEAFLGIEKKTYFLQEILKLGVITLGTHNVNLSHSRRIIRQTLRVYEKVLSGLKNVINSGTLRDKLETEPVLPIFRIR